MNGTRTIIRRKGYLLTALAAAVLLAASSGTAWAQSVGFVGDTEVMVMEGAGVTPGMAALQVTVRRTVTATMPNVFGGEDDGVLNVDHNGADIVGNATAAVMVMGLGETIGTGTALTFDEGVHEIVLSISIPEDDTDWDDEEFVLTLRSEVNGVIASPGVFTAMIQDNEPKPEFRFNRTTIDLTETSYATVDVSVGVGAFGSANQGALAVPLGALDANAPIIFVVDSPERPRQRTSGLSPSR